MKVFKIDLDNKIGPPMRSLGVFPLKKDAKILNVYTIQSTAILIVYSTSSGIIIERVQFPIWQSYGLSKGVPSHVKTFRRQMTRCDFLVSERLIAFLGTSDDIGLYKFSESFASMEVVRSVNLRVHTSLSAPVADMLLLESSIFVRDQTGAAQSVNLRSKQTSRKINSLNCRGEESSACGDLVSFADGLVVACLSVASDEIGSFHGEIAAISSEDNRKLPVTLGSDMELLSKDCISVQSIGNYLLVADLLRGAIYVYDVRVTVRSDSFRIRHTGGKATRGQRHPDNKVDDDARSEHEKLDHWLWAFYHVFEKFPVNGLLASQRESGEQSCMESLKLKLVCPNTSASSDTVYDDCRCYFECMMGHLRALNKPLGELDLANGMIVAAFNDAGIKELANELERLRTRAISSFLQDVVTFVPIQICRAESNMLTVMADGQNKSHYMEQSQQLQSADIARSIRFGLLTPLLESWRGRCIVITSMGKQSTGKSYFLNHLTGSSFAIAGARCTDGAWMTVRVLSNDVLLVVLDFEGLGSFERTEQEDVFLSVLNAAVSMFTVFRMEMRFDKEIDEIFSKFQKGIQLIKSDPRLFRGKLYMSVKDVNPNDQNGVLDEFIAKFEKLLGTNKEHNFLCDMYSGQLGINCSPPLGTRGYYQSLTDAQQYIEHDLCQRNRSVGFPNGKAFLDCVRLVLAKISILDWTSLDESNVKLQLSEVRSKLPGLIRTGCFIPNDLVADSKPIGSYLKEDIVLTMCGNQDSDINLQRMCHEYPDMADKWMALNHVVVLDDIRDCDIDLGLDCSTVKDTDQGLRAIGASMLQLFEMYLTASGTPVNGKLSAKMQTGFDVFLVYMVRRRRLRILAWAKSLLGDRLSEDWQAVESQFLGRFQMLFNRCLHTCAHCQLGCIQPAVHTAAIGHDCGMNHSCQGRCEYCEDAVGSEGKTPMCSKPAGHEGRCECATGDHTCGKECCLVRASNCGERCVKKAGHEGAHVCAVEIHRCGMACSAKSCLGLCILSIASPHSAHKCEEMKCIEKCSMDGCGELCGEHDHFHGQTDVAVTFSVENNASGDKGTDVFDAESETPTIHMCSKTHACQATCSEKGNCYVEVFHKESSKTYVGARGTFKYKFQEMNGFRKKCATVLEPGQRTHSGSHTCVQESHFDAEMDDPDEETKESEQSGNRTLHYCEARCPCCSYFCKKEYGHFGMHATSHGNMRNTYFLADTEDIDIEERKYRAGESGNAEMCNLYCSKMGRAHVHYLDCEQTSGQRCVYVGDTKDQRRHCTRTLEPKPMKEMDELLHEQFWKTLGWNDPCTSADECESFGKCAFQCDAPEHDDNKSYCTLPAWHKPDPKPAQNDGFSYISGHKFECSHLVDSGKMHHVFVLDCSGSMTGSPWDQLMAAYREYMYNRVNEGASLDLVSVVTFDNYGKIEYEAQNITTMLQTSVTFRGGGTVYSVGLRCANEVLSRNNFETYKPVVVFFSDGQPCDAAQGEEMAAHIKKSYAPYGLEAFAVGYGTVNLSILQRVAEKLGGAYHSVLLGTELKQAFHTISASLGTRAGLALSKPLHELTCPICQRDMAAEEVVKLCPCRHELHKSCKSEMVEAKARDGDRVLCPICRKEVVI
uniref:RING-type domain-containing protein n=1 Tax=Globisporangium ultimum (strain ATCC 200006 / CBS 805.95 / DAOM BR144) TaxID=431595 RepID=K3X2J3_GLOUD